MSATDARDGEQPTASSRLIGAMLSARTEALRLIEAHPGDPTRVLHGILAKAAELCGGEAGSITITEGETVCYVASHCPAMEPYVGTTAPAVADNPVVFSGAFHNDDFAAMAHGNPHFEQVATVDRVRSYAFVQLNHDGATVGALHMYRHEVRPFSEDELTALATFGEQASLAVANARLLKDLGESLKLQTATSEVLHLISAHPGDLSAVMDGLIERAVRLCAADDGVAWRFDGDRATFVANPRHRDSVGSSVPVPASERPSSRSTVRHSRRAPGPATSPAQPTRCAASPRSSTVRAPHSRHEDDRHAHHPCNGPRRRRRSAQPVDAGDVARR